MTTSIVRSVVFTNTSLRNGGDAAIVEAMEHLVEQAFGEGLDIVCEDIAPSSIDGRWDERTVRSYRVDVSARTRFGVVNRLRSVVVLGAALVWAHRPRWMTRSRTGAGSDCPMVISAGGTYLNNKYLAVDKLLNVMLAQRDGSVTVLFTQSLEHLDRRLERYLARRVFESADLVLLRDDRSLANLESMGIIAVNAHVVADAVFALADDEVWTKRRYRPGVGVVGISVRDCARFETQLGDDLRYRRSVAALCTRLVREHAASIRFVSTCQGVGEYHFDDSDVAADIAALLDDDVRARVTIDADFHRPDDFRSIVSDMDLFVSTRMHGAIQALAVGTPVIPIAYEPKTTELWSGFGLVDYCVDFDGGAPRLDEVFDMVARDIAGYRCRLDSGMAQSIQSARMTVALLSGLADHDGVGGRQAPIR